MRIKLVSVLITLLIASVVMFAGCIEKDKSTKVSEIIASPTSTPIIRAPIDIGDSADVYAMIIKDDESTCSLCVLRARLTSKIH